jgi:small subunit ribosomal protein S1
LTAFALVTYPSCGSAGRSRPASQIPTRDAVSPACQEETHRMSDIETTTDEPAEEVDTVGRGTAPADTAPSAEITAPVSAQTIPVVATPEPEGEDYTPEELVQAMEASLRDFKDGDIMEGVVVKIDRDEILLDIGYKSEGVIPSKELSIRHDVDPDEVVSVGDRIEALVLQKEDKEGRLILSKKRAQYERAWGRIEETMASGRTIKGPVIEVVKGGLILDIGLRGFLPASLVDLRRVRDLQPYIGTELECKIIELDRNRNNVVLSRRAFLEESQSEGRKKFLENLQKGERRKGTVSSIVNFGAFVDLGGVDGLVHVSELSWKHVDHPSEVVTVGQEVEVEVLDVDLERERVSLSLKATQEDPWKEFERRYKAGEVIPGQVTKLVPFGAFVRVAQGIEGLVHISELSHEHIDTPESVLSVGDEVQVKVVDVDVSRRRVSLSMRQVAPAPAKPPTEIEVEPEPERGSAEPLVPTVQVPQAVLDAIADDLPDIRDTTLKLLTGVHRCSLADQRPPGRRTSVTRRGRALVIDLYEKNSRLRGAALKPSSGCRRSAVGAASGCNGWCLAPPVHAARRSVRGPVQ